MSKLVKAAVDMGWRVLVIAAGYTLSLMVAGVVLGMLGLLEADTAQTADTASVLLWTFVGALIMGITLGVVARQVTAAAARHVLIWSVLLYANVGSVVIEGYFFVPDLVASFWVLLAQQLLPCLVSAWLVTRLFARRPAETPPAVIVHTPGQWLWRFGLSATTYLAAYGLFGALNFALVTRPYYEAQGTALAVPDTLVTVQAEVIRAVLIVLSLLPFLLTAQMPLRRLVLWSGLLLFVIGGIVPLTWQAGTLATPLLLASAAEIFLQNFITGVVAAFLLASPQPLRGTAGLRPA